MPDRRIQFTRPDSQRITIESSAEQSARPAQQLRGAVVGGGARGPIAVNPNSNREAARGDSSTLDALQAMGDALIRPAVERRQQEMFLEGARRQIEGEALADVVRDQPWYSRIFGPSATVQGARTLAQITKVEEFSTQLHADMPKLRALSSDEFQQELMHRIRNTTVGDSTADAAVQASLLENFGPLVRSHTNEHIAYVQEQMQEQFTGALMSHSRTAYMAVQGLVTGHMSEKDYQQVMGGIASALQPLEGQTSESYWASIEAATTEAAALGNFHFVNVVQDTLYEHMPADMRVKFLDERRKRENETISDLSAGEYALMIANVKAYSAEGLVDAQSTWDNIQEVNRRFRAQTGIQRDIIDHTGAEGIITNNIRGIVKEQKAAAAAARTRAEKEQEHFTQVQTAQLAFLSGQLGSYIAQGGDRQLAQDAAFSTVMTLMEHDYDWASLVAEQVNQDGFVIDPLKNRMRYGVQASIGEEYSPAFESSYQQWLQLYNAPGGRSAAAAYLGDDIGGAMERYHIDRIASGGDPTGPFVRNFAHHPTIRGADGAIAKEFAEYLRDNVTNPSWWQRTFHNAVPLHPSSAELVATTTSPYAATLNLPLGTEERFNRSLALARPTLDIAGEYAYRKPAGTASVKDYLGTDDVSAGMAFTRSVNNRLRRIGVVNPKYARFTIDRVGRGEEPAWVIQVWSGGDFQSVTLTGEQLRKEFQSPTPQVTMDRDNIPGVLMP